MTEHGDTDEPGARWRWMIGEMNSTSRFEEKKSASSSTQHGAKQTQAMSASVIFSSVGSRHLRKSA